MNDSQVIVILFGILYFAVVLWTRRKGNFEEFSVAGRGLGVFLIFSSISATYLGPGWSLGLTRDGFTNGLFLSCIGPAAGIGMMMVAVLFSSRVRNKFVDAYSIGDVIGGPRSHDNAYVKAVAGVVTVLFLSSLVIAMSYAGGELINNVFGFPKFWSIAIMTTVVMVYSYFGGIRATIQTDAIQFLHFVILIPILAVLMMVSDPFSWQEYLSFASSTTESTFTERSSTAIFGLFVLYLFGAHGLDAPIINRYLASKNDHVARKATLIAGAFIAMWTALMVFIGSIGAYLHPTLKDDDQVLLHLAQNHYPGFLYGIFIIAMIGVVMSSQDSLLNSAAVSFAEDVVGGLTPRISDEQKLSLSKVFTLILGVIAISVASFLDSILNTVMTLIEFYVPVMIPVTLFSILKTKHYWPSAIAAVIGGLTGHLVWENLGSEWVPSILAGVILSTICYLGTDLLIERKSAGRTP